MSEIKGYTVEELAQIRKARLVEDYSFCKKKLAEIKQWEQEIKNLRNTYDQLVVKYRIDSVSRVLDFIRSEYVAGRICDLDTLLWHCQNKLNGNIDGTELTLDKGETFKILKVGGSE